MLSLLMISAMPVMAELELPEVLKVGEQAPESTLNNLDAEPVVFPVKGSYSLIFYWSLFCHSCLGEVPEVSRRLAEISDERVKAFFVSLDTDRMITGLQNFVERNNLEMPVLVEEIVGQTYKSADKWRVMQTPTAFVVCPEGEIVKVIEGPLNIDEYFDNLNKLLESESE